MAAAGVYFILIGLDVLPVPDGSAGAPTFVIVLAGLAFLFAGANVIVRGRTGARDNESNLPAASATWATMPYRVFGIAIAGTLATIGTWIAIGSGPRQFTVSGPIPAGETLGRAIFGLGAVIAWIYVIAITVGTVRKIFDRDQRQN